MGADREPNSTYALASTLENIQYPTGGSTMFKFQYLRGSIRVKQIINNDLINRDQDTTTYQYQYISPSLPVFMENYTIVCGIVPYFDGGANLTPCNETTEDAVLITSNSLVPIPTLYYHTVNVVKGDTITLPFGYSVYNFTYPSQQYRESQPHVYLSNVDRTTHLVKETHYRKDNQGIFYPVLMKEYDYTISDLNLYKVRGLRVSQNETPIGECQALNDGVDVYQYAYANAVRTCEWSYMSAMREYQYNSTDGALAISKETKYYYDEPSHTQLTSMAVINSDLSKDSTKYYYTQSQYGTAPYTQMIDDFHILNPVIKQEMFRNNKQIHGRVTEYFQPYTTVFTPSKFKQWNRDLGYEDRVIFHAYDTHGNITWLTDEKGIDKTYLWSYNYSQPVAEITNATLPQVETAVSNQQGDFISTLASTRRQSTIDTKLNALTQELEQDLPQAHAMVYTYKPLVGMTTATDANGSTESYEYDDFFRLSLVKNSDMDITKKYTYNYAQGTAGSGYEAPVLEIDKTSLRTYYKGIYTLNITSNISWTASIIYYYDKTNWLKLPVSSGRGNEALPIEVLYAPSSGYEKADVVIFGSGLKRTFTIQIDK